MLSPRDWCHTADPSLDHLVGEREWHRRQRGGIEQNVSKCGNIEKVIRYRPSISPVARQIGVPTMLRLPKPAAIAIQATLGIALSAPWAVPALAEPANTATQSQTTPLLHE